MLTRVLRFSVLPVLSLNEGILHCDIVEGSFDSDLFYQFIERLLDQMQPYPAENSVIVMDNCRIHKHPTILERIEQRWVIFTGISLLFWPHWFKRDARRVSPPLLSGLQPNRAHFSCYEIPSSPKWWIHSLSHDWAKHWGHIFCFIYGSVWNLKGRSFWVVLALWICLVVVSIPVCE